MTWAERGRIGWRHQRESQLKILCIDVHFTLVDFIYVTILINAYLILGGLSPIFLLSSLDGVDD